MYARTEYSDGSSVVDSFECGEDDIFSQHAYQREAMAEDSRIVRVVFYT